MLDSTGSLVLLTGAGLILLRPADVPLFARMAGRIVGLTVRGLRNLREVTEEALSQGEQELNKQGKDVSALREDLRQSFSRFDSLRTEVARDMRSVSHFASVAMIRNRFMKQANTLQPQLVERLKQMKVEDPDGERGAINIRKLPSMTRTSGKADTPAGVDFIARSIEEAALAKQQQRIFSGHVPSPQSNKSTADSNGSQPGN